MQGKGGIKAGDPQITAAVKDVVTRLERIDGVTNIESPLDRAYRASTVSKDGRSVVVNFTLPGDPPSRTRSSRSPRRRWPRSRRCRRRIRRCAWRSTARRRSASALGAQERRDEAKSLQLSLGGTLLILLLAFGAAVAAGVPLFLGITAFIATTGSARSGQPGHAAARGGRPGDDARRPRRRRRLRDVLSAPDGRGAGQGPLSGGRARGRRGDVGPRGRHLRPDRDGGDGRDVLLRQPDLRVLRDRDDHRRRRRGRRVADGAARAAVVPRREGLAGEGSRAVGRQAPSPGTRRVSRRGARSSIACWRGR